MPPVAVSVVVYAAPTAPAGREAVVIEGAAGTVIVALPVLVLSAIEVAVTVTFRAVLEAAGAV
jgi:hypothetical protein